MPPLYTLKNVVQRFGEREVLNIPELVLEANRIYALLGPNGAGKTTLMRILSFMDNPVSGSIAFMGVDVPPEHASRYRARVVWVPQSPVMFTGTLRYNVEYPMRLKGINRRERKDRAMELLESVNLARLARAPARRLSGGEAQRGSIARALAAGAEVILFDEPTASVDFRSRGEIMNLIHTLWSTRGLSLIVTTHDASLAAELCPERITLFDGRLVPPAPEYAPDPVGGHAATRRAPYGLSAWPGRLSRRDGAFRITLPREAFYGLAADDQAASLTAITQQGAGFFLRLALDARAETLDVFLPLADNGTLARELHLGTRLDLRADRD